MTSAPTIEDHGFDLGVLAGIRAPTLKLIAAKLERYALSDLVVWLTPPNDMQVITRAALANHLRRSDLGELAAEAISKYVPVGHVMLFCATEVVAGFVTVPLCKPSAPIAPAMLSRRDRTRIAAIVRDAVSTPIDQTRTSP